MNYICDTKKHRAINKTVSNGRISRNYRQAYDILMLRTISSTSTIIVHALNRVNDENSSHFVCLPGDNLSITVRLGSINGTENDFDFSNNSLTESVIGLTINTKKLHETRSNRHSF